MLKISSPTHPEINEVFCDRNSSCSFEFGIDKAIQYSLIYKIPAKIYICGNYSGILPTTVYNQKKGYKNRK